MNRSQEIRKQHSKFVRELKRKSKRKYIRKEKDLKNPKRKKALLDNISYREYLKKFAPPNLRFILFEEKSPFFFDTLERLSPPSDGVIQVPSKFSIIDNEKESYEFLQSLLALFLFPNSEDIYIDYQNSKEVDLGAQVLLDIIIIEIMKFYEKRKDHPERQNKFIHGRNVEDTDVDKMLCSVGSKALFTPFRKEFNDIIPYHLCIHESTDKKRRRDQSKKDVDTTTLIEYLINCTAKIGRDLTPSEIDDLCIVIGEILINAEEHSTTRIRYSIGYFQEKVIDGKITSVFRLVIMNFGDTIYGKFKDPNCPNQGIVKKMVELTDHYLLNRLFGLSISEETLWTLYALQEGITSVSSEKYRKRGNGSIRFIESFFKLKKAGQKENISRMNIISGSTSIQFSGEYDIAERNIDEEKFKVMTFNKKGNIFEKPDSKFVKRRNYHFPGTLISARIQF
ncbi:hypothetical protein [Leptospira borgpetersenii]|uniref:hypothetical protein n=1 Tax=Leptospira borgpetersenii TaxID=174 RepID=UPI000A454737|nr:hypothetical protein [Leptospira borgpetersenii]